VTDCPQCGANLREDARFCPQCGVSLAAAGMTTGPLATGATLQGGRYQVIGLLGQGGMGAVYLAKDMELFERLCVIKQMQLLFASQTERKKAESDFRREAELLVQLNHPGHPHIPEIYDYFIETGDHYLVMKYVAGESLETRLERLGRPLDEAEAILYALPVCDGLVYLHSRKPQPVIHRDIKPANIIVDPQGRVWLVDFGLAKASIEQGALVMMDGGKTVAAGTPGYAPLEQWQLKPEPKSDIYALGATIHHLLTNQDPRDRFCTFPELDLQILKELSSFRPLQELRPDVSPELAQLVARALHSDAASRPSAEEMKKALEKLAPTGSRALQTIQRWSPTIGKLIGTAVATFFERLFRRRSPDSEPRQAPPGPQSPPTDQAGKKPAGKGLLCLYCRGSGLTKEGRRCPVCGGDGYW
jgi:serine/threonine protein kinase